MTSRSTVLLFSRVLMLCLLPSGPSAAAASLKEPARAAVPTRRTVVPPPEPAKVLWFGPSASFASESDLGIGARAMWAPFRHPRVGLITSLDYFFPGSSDVAGVDNKHYEANGNLVYQVHQFGRRWRPYVGPGLNLARRTTEVALPGETSASATDTSLGINLLGGVRRVGDRARSRQYFAEARYEVKGGEQFLVSAGVLF